MRIWHLIISMKNQVKSYCGNFHKDMLCNIYKNNMSFFTSETLFRKYKKLKEKI